MIGNINKQNLCRVNIMKYSLLSQNISIVLLGNFNPETLGPIWMVKKNILSVVDLKNGIKSSPDCMDFETQKFKVLITRDRIQVVSFDISNSDVISSFVVKLLMCKKEEVKAVGVNSQKIFALFNGPDILKFCHRFAPLDALTPISCNSLMINMEWLTWEEPQTNSSPRKKVTLKRMRLDDENPSFSISVNNHFRVETFEEAIYLIESKANELHLVFNDQFDELLKSI